MNKCEDNCFEGDMFSLLILLLIKLNYQTFSCLKGGVVVKLN